MASQLVALKERTEIGVRDLGVSGSRINVAGSGHDLDEAAKLDRGVEGGARGLVAGFAGTGWTGGRFSETQSLQAAKALEVAMHTFSGFLLHY